MGRSGAVAQAFGQVMAAERRLRDATGDDGVAAASDELASAALWLAREPALGPADAAAKLRVLCLRLRRELPPDDPWALTNFLLAESGLAALEGAAWEGAEAPMREGRR